jgi:beta-N-acetylhexosaminidase
VVKAFITGVAGDALTPEEIAFLRAERPLGLILFQRNCIEPRQIRDLVAAFRDAVGHDAFVLIDQEGGRVQRLKPPQWPAYPPPSELGRLHGFDQPAGHRATWLHGRLIAADLRELGIDVDCVPVLDLAGPDAPGSIGNRAFGADTDRVVELSRAMVDGLMAGGVLPVIKHLPGQGRATADSHVALPVVDTDVETLAATDFVPFVAMSDLPLGMTAHVVYSAVDAVRPATISPLVIRDIIRKRIRFDGLLMTDDIGMDALSGDFRERAAAAYAAGVDLVLYCKGRTEEMRAVADAAPELAGLAARRADRALVARGDPEPFDREAAREEYRALLSQAAGPVTS